MEEKLRFVFEYERDEQTSRSLSRAMALKADG
jgi:hypothetical protein